MNDPIQILTLILSSLMRPSRSNRPVFLPENHERRLLHFPVMSEHHRLLHFPVLSHTFYTVEHISHSRIIYFLQNCSVVRLFVLLSFEFPMGMLDGPEPIVQLSSLLKSGPVSPQLLSLPVVINRRVLNKFLEIGLVNVQTVVDVAETVQTGKGLGARSGHDRDCPFFSGMGLSHMKGELFGGL